MKKIGSLLLIVVLLGACRHKTSKPYKFDYTYDVPDIQVTLVLKGVTAEQAATAPEFEASIEKSLGAWLDYFKSKGLPRPVRLKHGVIPVIVEVEKVCHSHDGSGDWSLHHQEMLDMGIKGWSCTESRPSLKKDQLSWACHRVCQVYSGCTNCYELFQQIAGC